MAVVMMDFADSDLSKYDGVIRDLDLENNPAEGGIHHVAGLTAGGLRVIDVWESQEHFDRFVQSRLGQLHGKHQVAQPTVTTWPVHNIWTPKS